METSSTIATANPCGKQDTAVDKTQICAAKIKAALTHELPKYLQQNNLAGGKKTIADKERIILDTQLLAKDQSLDYKAYTIAKNESSQYPSPYQKTAL